MKPIEQITPSRRKFMTQLALGMMFYGKKSRAQQETPLSNQLEWPSKISIGSVPLQTAELTLLLNSGASILVKSGQHKVNGPIICTNTSSRLSGMVGAVIQFSNGTEGGFRFVRGKHVEVKNLKLVWQGDGQPSRSHYGAGLMFFQVENALVDGVTVIRAPGAGVHFDECENSQATNIIITQTGADGVHFANCNNSFAQTIVCRDTGDDAVAFVDYTKKPQGIGFRLDNVKIFNSQARGIAVVGATQGLVTNFEIDGCASNCIHIEQDLHYQTRRPSNVIFQNGIARNAGSVTPKKGNQYGANILRASKISIVDVSIENSSNIGVSVIDSEDVTLRRVSSKNSAGFGIKLVNSSLALFKIDISSTNSSSLVVVGCEYLIGEDVTISDQGNTPSLPVALFKDNNQIELVNLKFKEYIPSKSKKALIANGHQRGKIITYGLVAVSISNQSEFLNVVSN
jgi:hypothetical protein